MEKIRESTQTGVKADMIAVLADWIEQRDGPGHAFLREIAEEFRKSQWRPIETATKDNGARLVWCPGQRNTFVVVWGYRREEGEMGWVHFGGNAPLSEHPTHWRPLPPSPGN